MFPIHRVLSLLAVGLGAVIIVSNLRLGARLRPGEARQHSGSPGDVAAVLGRNSVPFYIYDDPLFEKIEKGCNDSKLVPMHMADAYWLRAIRDHPWRVRDPDQATLFVLPICAACHLRKACQFRFREAMKMTLSFLKTSEHFLRNGGIDHLMVCSDWNIALRSPWRELDGLANITVAHKGYFSHVRYRCTVPVPFTVNPFIQPMMRKRLKAFEERNTWKPAVSVPATPDALTRLPVLESILEEAEPLPIIPWIERDYRLFFMGKLKRPAKERKIAFSILPGVFPKSVLISTDVNSYQHCDFTETRTLDGCSLVGKFKPIFAEFISNSKFNVHMEGDDYHSSRVSDAVAAGTPSILISSKLWTRGLPNSCQAPWQKMAFGIRPNVFRQHGVATVAAALYALEGLPPSAYGNSLNPRALRRLDWTSSPKGELPTNGEAMAELLDRHAADVLWEAPGSRVTSNILTNVARVCLPNEVLQAQAYPPAHFFCEFPDLLDP